MRLFEFLLFCLLQFNLKFDEVYSINVTHILNQYALVCGPDFQDKTLNTNGFPEIPEKFKLCSFCSKKNDCYLSRKCCPDTEFSFPKMECRSNVIFSNSDDDDDFKYEFVTECPKNSNTELRDRCQKIGSVIDRIENAPVMSRTSGISYANKFCALCHKVTDIVQWQVAVQNRCLNISHTATIQTIIQRVITEGCGTITYESGLAEGQRCEDENNKGLISTCNVTGTWLKYDPDIEYACHSSGKQYENFKNVFCFICNPPSTHTNTGIISNCSKTAMPEIQNACHRGGLTRGTTPYKNIYCYICQGTQTNRILTVTPSEVSIHYYVLDITYTADHPQRIEPTSHSQTSFLDNLFVKWVYRINCKTILPISFIEDNVQLILKIATAYKCSVYMNNNDGPFLDHFHPDNEYSNIGIKEAEQPSHLRVDYALMSSSYNVTLGANDSMFHYHCTDGGLIRYLWHNRTDMCGSFPHETICHLFDPLDQRYVWSFEALYCSCCGHYIRNTSGKLDRFNVFRIESYKSISHQCRERQIYDQSKVGIDPDCAPKNLKRRLKAYNCIIQSYREADQTQKSYFSRTVNGILHKYKMVNIVGKEIGMNRKTLAKGKIQSKRKRLPMLMTEKRRKIDDFLSRDDNSRQLPGKKDYKKIGKDKVQRRVLNDFMSNLWKKFSAENPNISVSLAFFCHCRPKNISLTSLIHRRRCLCIYHQNMALKLKATLKIPNPNPDSIFRQKTDNEILTDITDKIKTTLVIYNTWKRTLRDGKMRTSCVQETRPKDEFIKDMESNIEKFRQHIKRVSTQYEQIKRLKETLRKDHVAIHIDFSENYNCSSIDEVQSAFWNPPQISLHPAVVYYKNNEAKVRHKSFIFLSDDIQHNSSAVLCIIAKLTPAVKELVPDVKCIHFISDGPTSQYRNRYMMYMIANFEQLYNIPLATWTYLEVGHGKGPCDGVGGTAKRNADISVTQGKVVIQSASDFCKWGQNSTVQYILYTTEEINEKKRFLENSKPIAVKNTMELHAVCSQRPGFVTVRHTSCFCQDCFSNGIMLCYCEGWRTQFVGEVTAQEKGVHIRESIDNDCLIVVYTDDPGESFYLLKANGKALVLDKSKSDAWGSKYQKGTEVVPGFYFQMEDSNSNNYRLVPRLEALVPIQAVVYVVNEVVALPSIILPESIKQEILKMISDTHTKENEQ